MSLFGQDNAPHGKKGKQLNSEVIVSSRQDSSPMWRGQQCETNKALRSFSQEDILTALWQLIVGGLGTFEVGLPALWAPRMFYIFDVLGEPSHDPEDEMDAAGWMKPRALAPMQILVVFSFEINSPFYSSVIIHLVCLQIACACCCQSTWGAWQIYPEDLGGIFQHAEPAWGKNMWEIGKMWTL